MLVTFAALKAALFGLMTVDMAAVAATVADNPNYVNVALNFASLAILVAGAFFAPRALRAKRQEAQLLEKDTLIRGHQQLAELKEQEANSFREKAAELGAALDESRSEAAAWQARYQEQSQYTAAPALETIHDLMKHANDEAERRHKETLMVLRALRALAPRASGDVGDGLAEGV